MIEPGYIEVKALFLTAATILRLSIVCLPLAMGGPIESTPPASAPPFQIDSSQLAETMANTQNIRSYGQLMVSSHITVNNALAAILKNKAATPPPTLLRAAYSTIISTLEREDGQTFDADYMKGQVNYQKANARLYQYELANGSDTDLKAFPTDPAKDSRPFGPRTEATRWRGVA